MTKRSIDTRLSTLERGAAIGRPWAIVFESEGRTYAGGPPWEEGAHELGAVELAALEATHDLISVAYVPDWRGTDG